MPLVPLHNTTPLYNHAPTHHPLSSGTAQHTTASMVNKEMEHVDLWSQTWSLLQQQLSDIQYTTPPAVMRAQLTMRPLTAIDLCTPALQGVDLGRHMANVWGGGCKDAVYAGVVSEVDDGGDAQEVHDDDDNGMYWWTLFCAGGCCPACTSWRVAVPLRHVSIHTHTHSIHISHTQTNTAPSTPDAPPPPPPDVGAWVGNASRLQYIMQCGDAAVSTSCSIHTHEGSMNNNNNNTHGDQNHNDHVNYNDTSKHSSQPWSTMVNSQTQWPTMVNSQQWAALQARMHGPPPSAAIVLGACCCHTTQAHVVGNAGQTHNSSHTTQAHVVGNAGQTHNTDTMQGSRQAVGHNPHQQGTHVSGDAELQHIMQLASATLPAHGQFLANCVSQPLLFWVWLLLFVHTSLFFIPVFCIYPPEVMS